MSLSAEQQLGLQFGPVNLRLTVRDALIASDIRDRLALRTRIASDAAWSVTVERMPLGSLGNTPYQMDVVDSDRTMRFESPFLRGRVHFAHRSARLEVWRHPRFGSGHFVENALRYLTQIISLRAGSILLHAAGIVCPDRQTARVFPGASGSGKTTITTLLESLGGRVLSDDLVLLTPRSTGALVTATPFRGDHTGQHSVHAPSATIESIHTLKKSPRPHIDAAVSKGRAAALLIANTPFSESWSADLRERALGIVAAIVDSTSVEPLSFPKNTPFVEVFGGWLEPERSIA